LRFFYHAHHARDSRVGGQSRHSHNQCSTPVDGARKDVVPDPLLDRHRLPGDGGLVRCRMSLQDNTINREALARAHEHALARPQVPDRDYHGAPLTLDGGLLWRQFHERTDGVPCPVRRGALQGLADREEEKSDGSLGVFAYGHGTYCRDDHEHVHVQRMRLGDGNPCSPRQRIPAHGHGQHEEQARQPLRSAQPAHGERRHQQHTRPPGAQQLTMPREPAWALPVCLLITAGICKMEAHLLCQGS